MGSDQELEIQRAERELHDAINALRQIEGKPPLPHRVSDPATTHEAPFCSFCGRGTNEVRMLVKGHSAYICDECVILASEIITND
jgi:chaperonin GroEL (HSP60 family)